MRKLIPFGAMALVLLTADGFLLHENVAGRTPASIEVDHHENWFVPKDREAAKFSVTDENVKEFERICLDIRLDSHQVACDKLTEYFARKNVWKQASFYAEQNCFDELDRGCTHLIQIAWQSTRDPEATLASLYHVCHQVIHDEDPNKDYTGITGDWRKRSV